MKEILFIRNNIDKWRSVEELIDNVNFEMPDRLAEAYTDLTAELSFCTNTLSSFTYYNLSKQPFFLSS